MNKPLLLIPLMFAAVAIFWLAIALLLSALSGWRSLARHYRGRLPEEEGRISMASGSMRMIALNHVVTFATGAHGIGMSMFGPFALVSPPLAIPWDQVEECRRYQALGMFDRFAFRAGGVRVTANGAAARMLDEAWQRYGQHAGALQPQAVQA
ncbi:MAG TPA: hypothetical protein VFS20_20065 [Longimicrobium sp.]|nr:hypothetical protein [Longimicrobium sp.]